MPKKPSMLFIGITLNNGDGHLPSHPGLFPETALAKVCQRFDLRFGAQIRWAFDYRMRSNLCAFIQNHRAMCGVNYRQRSDCAANP